MTQPDDPHPFGDLTPEAFARDSSAREQHGHPAAMTNLGLHRGEVGFRLFVDLRLHECRQRLLTDQDFESYAVLSSATDVRYFYGEEDEFVDHFANRLRREARAMEATWLFVAMLGPFRVRPAGSDHAPIDLDDLHGIEAATARGDMQVGLLWSASQREGHLNTYRGGVIHLDSSGLPTREVEGVMNADTDVFSAVLER